MRISFDTLMLAYRDLQSYRQDYGLEFFKNYCNIQYADIFSTLPSLRFSLLGVFNSRALQHQH